MTAVEAYELASRGGASTFARVIAACEDCGAYCLIGGLAVNYYVEPVYTLGADIVVAAAQMGGLAERLASEGFRIARHVHSVNVHLPESDLRIQFITDERYQQFPSRATTGVVLGVKTRIARLEDVTLGKAWAFSDPARRLSKRKKDELDLIRLAEAYPALKTLLPREIVEQIERG